MITNADEAIHEETWATGDGKTAPNFNRYLAHSRRIIDSRRAIFEAWPCSLLRDTELLVLKFLGCLLIFLTFFTSIVQLVIILQNLNSYGLPLHHHSVQSHHGSPCSGYRLFFNRSSKGAKVHNDERTCRGCGSPQFCGSRQIWRLPCPQQRRMLKSLDRSTCTGRLASVYHLYQVLLTPWVFTSSS